MKIKILLLLFFIANLSSGQNRTHLCANSKSDHFTKLKKNSEINYPGDESIDVGFYKLNLTLDFDQRKLNGIVTIKAKSLQTNLTNVFFDLQNYYTITSVKSNGQSLSSNFQDNKINITLEKPYGIGEEFTVDIAYNGTPGSSGLGSFEFYTVDGNPVIWTLSEPYGSSDWWPSKDTPADKADSSEVWITK